MISVAVRSCVCDVNSEYVAIYVNYFLIFYSKQEDVLLLASVNYKGLVGLRGELDDPELCKKKFEQRMSDPNFGS